MATITRHGPNGEYILINCGYRFDWDKLFENQKNIANFSKDDILNLFGENISKVLPLIEKKDYKSLGEFISEHHGTITGRDYGI